MFVGDGATTARDPRQIEQHEAAAAEWAHARGALFRARAMAEEATMALREAEKREASAWNGLEAVAGRAAQPPSMPMAGVHPGGRAF